MTKYNWLIMYILYTPSIFFFIYVQTLPQKHKRRILYTKINVNEIVIFSAVNFTERTTANCPLEVFRYLYDDLLASERIDVKTLWNEWNMVKRRQTVKPTHPPGTGVMQDKTHLNWLPLSFVIIPRWGIDVQMRVV